MIECGPWTTLPRKIASTFNASRRRRLDSRTVGYQHRWRRRSTAWRTWNVDWAVSGGQTRAAQTTETSHPTFPFWRDCEPLTLRTALGEIGQLLDGLSIQWVLAGGIAANRYRRSPRHTDDVDLLLADAGPGLAALESALTAAGWFVRRVDPKGDLLRARHSEFGPVDLLIAGTQYQQEALRRARGDVESVPEAGAVPVLTVEDVIVHKLIAGRYRDLADIEEILESKPLLEEAYIERWADFWEVLDRWHQLSARRGETAPDDR